MIDTPQQQFRVLAGASAAAVGFVVVLLAMLLGWLDDLDSAIGEWPAEFTADHSGFRQVLLAIASGTRPVVLAFVVAAIAGLLIWRGLRRAALWSALVFGAVSGVLNPLLKRLIGRERPDFHEVLPTLGDSAFPSGHTSGMAALAGIAMVIAAMLVRRRALRRLAWAGAILLVVIVGADRVFLGVHHTSDVVAGALLAAGVVLGSLLVYEPTPRVATARARAEASVATGERRLGAVINPAKVEDVAAFKAMVERMAVESGWASVSWWETTVEDTGYEMAHDAAVGGSALVLAIGGDGTVRAVCEELAGTGIPVGLIPAGTGNLLARNLDIPLYLRAAVDVALNGTDRAIDMVEVTGDDMEPAVFLVMAGMGFDAAIMEGVNEDFKQRVGWLAYVWSALKALLFPAIRVEVSVDGGEFTSHRARTVVIGNVGYLQAGMPLIPDAEIDDGNLDVVLLYPRRFLSWLPVAARVLTKNPRTDDSIVRMSGREVVVRCNTSAPRQLDGDLINSGRELRAACVPGRLLVRVPR